MVDPITAAVIGAGVSLSDIAGEPLSIANKEQLVDDIKRKSTERQRRLADIRDQTLMQQSAFRQGAKINQDSPPPRILSKKPPVVDPESEYLGRREAEKAIANGVDMMTSGAKASPSVNRKQLPKNIVKTAYERGIEKAAEDMGLSDFEKTAIILKGLKAVGRGIYGAGRQLGLWGTKTKDLAALSGRAAANPQRTANIMNRVTKKPGVSYAPNASGGLTRSRQGLWTRQSAGSKAQIIGGTAALGIGYGANKALNAHSQAMNSPGAFKMGKPNDTAARLAAKTYGVR